MRLHNFRNQYDNTSGLAQSIRHHARISLGKNSSDIISKDLFQAIALAVRDLMINGMLKTEERYQSKDCKKLYYLSMEYLLGRSLSNNLSNLGIFNFCRETVSQMGFDLDEIEEIERDAALGNGGLGRLAACFLDSMASLGLPGFGYGINFEYGFFKQELDNGYQKERPDNWERERNLWQIERPEQACLVPIYGKIDHSRDRKNDYNPMWIDWNLLIGVPHDMPVAGYGGHTVNRLRLFSARSPNDFDIGIFNEGDYLKAVQHKLTSETVSKVLYPSDSIRAGKELRLVQEYFLVACSIRDITRQYLKNHSSFLDFPKKAAIQLNDTHPALAVAELMRVLVDENSLPWEKAWEITHATLGYTNHTLLSEALEKWSVDLMEHVLPRHMQIIYEINHRFLRQVATIWPDDIGRLEKVSLIEEGKIKQVRMANLAVVGCHSVNGVAAMHSELVKSDLFPDFYKLWPEKFNNKTNGISQRRWLLKANPLLAGLISKSIGDGWIMQLGELKKLEPFAQDLNFQNEFSTIKRSNKKRLARIIYETSRLKVNPDSLFDVHIKRIHEYKRQLLNALHIIHQYLSLVEDGRELAVPKTYIFSGKAAPTYFAAKQIIKLINNIADVINNDPRVRDQIKVVFLPDYRVSLAENIIPAADLSEQISTAGMEASGTGNMKMAMNGALTIGTLDGANVEILQEVGAENIYIFGHEAEEVKGIVQNKRYQPAELYERNPDIKRVVDSLGSDRFCLNEPGLFKSIQERLLSPDDPYLHLADLEPYIATQRRAASEYTDPSLWIKKAILNVARMGKFSSDRTISEYADEIWDIKPVS